jgi:putative nucleotidyltransferase with HDIG domain
MKILIVDDESISRRILTAKMGLIGDCTSIDDSLEALELIDKAAADKAPFDLVTLDVSMPKMDGKQLLNLIRKREKTRKIDKEDRLKIIMITSRMNMATIQTCIKLGCDGYITKPVSKYQLLDNLGRMGFTTLGDVEHDEADTITKTISTIIKKFYKREIMLPVLPRIVEDTRKLLASKTPSIDDLSKIIGKDIVISSKLISIANSPLYRGVDKADTLAKALVRLGIKVSQGIITSLVTKEMFQSDNKALTIALEKLWMHSFACACIGKHLAEELKGELKIKDPDNVFLMGIVHDIGKMLLLKAFANMNPDESFESSNVQMAIHEIHTTFGGVVLKRLRFSNEFVRVAEFHHWNDFAHDEEKELLIINIADRLADAMGFIVYDLEGVSEDKRLENILNTGTAKQLKLTKDKLLEIMEATRSLIQTSAHSF